MTPPKPTPPPLTGNRRTCNPLKYFGMLDLFGNAPQFRFQGRTNYKTVFGCFWTVLTALLILGAAVYYGIIYTDKTNVDLSSQELLLSTKPFMNLTEKGIFMVMGFKQNGAYIMPGAADGYFSIQAHMYTLKSTEDASGVRTMTSTTPDTSKLEFQVCSTAKIGNVVMGQTIKGATSRLFSDYGFCLVSASTPVAVEGDEDTDTHTWADIRIHPCVGSVYTGPPPIPKGMCWLPNPQKGSPKLTETEVTALRTNLRNLEVIFAFVDVSIQAENYTNPIFYKLNTENTFVPMATQEKIIEVQYKEFNVETEKGILWSDVETTSSFSLQPPSYDSKDRDPSDLQDYDTPKGKLNLPLPYITLKVKSGNAVVNYERNYVMLLDILGLMGGLTETITVIIVILYGWYNGIMMEKDKLNLAILQLSSVKQKKAANTKPSAKYVERQSTSQEAESSMRGLRRSNTVFQKLEEDNLTEFTFSEVFKYTYFKCAVKKDGDKKFKLFEKCSEIAEDTTDIVKIVKAVADIETIRDAIFTDEQKALLPYCQTYDIFRSKSGRKLSSIDDELEKLDMSQFSEEELVDTVSKLLMKTRHSSKGLDQHPELDREEITAEVRINKYLVSRSPITLNSSEGRLGSGQPGVDGQELQALELPVNMSMNMDIPEETYPWKIPEEKIPAQANSPLGPISVQAVPEEHNLGSEAAYP